MKLIVNEGYSQTKVFDNVEYTTGPTNSAKLSFASYSNDKQNSYTITGDEIIPREGTYKFAIPRASGTGNMFQERMRGKYIICNYEFKRKDIASNYYFSIPYIKTIYRYSKI
jgi:hypothetical protein